MSRPIKFRAWDTDEKKMIFMKEDLSTFLMRTSDSQDEHFSFLSRYPLMQFTGLHDKNGKEIWEGDIIKWDDQDFRKKTGPMLLKASVTFYWGSFRVEGKIPGDWKGCLPPPTIDLNLGQMHSVCEVLGNIYSNPELLK